MDRIWIVGASQGIGLAVTRQLLQKKYRVIASARHCESNSELLQLKQQFGEQLKLLNLDVTDEPQINHKIDQAWSFWQGIDVWLYNAGQYQPMTLKESTNQMYHTLNNVNYLGCVYLLNGLFARHDVQPQASKMKWVWNLSLANQFGLPYGGGYSAPKAALLNLAESLQPELAKEQIDLHIINHGFVKTRLTAKNNFNMPSLMTAEQTAEKIVHFMFKGTSFELSFPFAFAQSIKLLKHLPYRLSLYLTQKLLK